MNSFNSITQHLNNKTVVHGSMLAFAITSTLNIAGFFVATHHHALVAASAGLALGAGLMAVSIYLSKQEFGKGLSFWTLLISTVAMAILSGQIQSMAYQTHGLDTYTSRLLGFAPPFVAEVLLALSVSLAEKTERERAQRDSKQFIKDSVAESMTSAFRNVDASRIQKHIEKQVDGVIRAFVDDALGEMMAELNAGRSAEPQNPLPNDAGIVQPTAQEVQTPSANSHQTAGFGPANLPEANAERQRLIAERRAAILHLFATYGQMGVADLQNRLRDDCNLDASERTLRGDLQALEDAGDLLKAGRGAWRHAYPIAVELPTMPAPILNGHSHG